MKLLGHSTSTRHFFVLFYCPSSFLLSFLFFHIFLTLTEFLFYSTRRSFCPQLYFYMFTQTSPHHPKSCPCQSMNLTAVSFLSSSAPSSAWPNVIIHLYLIYYIISLAPRTLDKRRHPRKKRKTSMELNGQQTSPPLLTQALSGMCEICQLSSHFMTCHDNPTFYMHFLAANSPGPMDMYSSSQDSVSYVQATSPQPSGFPPLTVSMGPLMAAAFTNGYH
ncbi:unnamed protein product [Ixodes persulcatus]